MSMIVTIPGRQLLPNSAALGTLLFVLDLFPVTLLARVSPIAVKPFVRLWHYENQENPFQLLGLILLKAGS